LATHYTSTMNAFDQDIDTDLEADLEVAPAGVNENYDTVIYTWRETKCRRRRR
jgi:hypothetical protein